jgi:hypothetical protein
MKPTTAAICGFFVAILNSGIANAADTLVGQKREFKGEF